LKPKRIDTIATVLFTTEDNSSNLKSYGDTQGQSGAYIYNYIGTYTRVSADHAPATSGSGMVKIPVDLNEGAGGYFIYLYYSKTDELSQSLCYIGTRSGAYRMTTSYPAMTKLGMNIGGGLQYWTDMNDGAGGEYIYLEGLKPSNYDKADPVSGIPFNGGRNLGCSIEPIKNLMVVGTGEDERTFSSKMYSRYPGWHMVYKDLNDGAGGAYVYLCYKK